MVRDNKNRLGAQSKPFAFHRRRDHLKSFPRADLVRQQGVAAVNNVRDSVQLMFA